MQALLVSGLGAEAAEKKTTRIAKAELRQALWLKGVPVEAETLTERLAALIRENRQQRQRASDPGHRPGRSFAAGCGLEPPVRGPHTRTSRAPGQGTAAASAKPRGMAAQMPPLPVIQTAPSA